MATVTGAATAVVAARPALRGVLHAVMAPVALVAGVLLAVAARGGMPQVGAAVYAATGVGLFTVSAAYHRGRWSPQARRRMRLLDHSMIFAFMAGSETVVAFEALSSAVAAGFVAAVAACALAGVLLVWLRGVGGPVSALYVALAAAGLLVVPGVIPRWGTGALLLLVGLASYSVGGLVVRWNRPNPWPRIFGHHEVFHALTVVAAVAQYVAVYRLAVAPG